MLRNTVSRQKLRNIVSSVISALSNNIQVAVI